MSVFHGAPRTLRRVLAPLLIWFAAAVVLADGPKSPLSPEDERKTFQIADPRLLIELVAAEPQIDSPVAIAWDAAGAMYVAEMPGYPETMGQGRIRRLEDRDGDGRYEHATVFADSLDFPNGVLPYKDGIFVTAAPDILFLKDTNGDGAADERMVMFTGFHHGNEQLLVNGLYWGHDNWIYGANGRSDGLVRRADQPAEQAISIRTQDFRFHPETLEFQPLPGQSQFGAARDDWGNRFLSWNTIPIRQALLGGEHVQRNPQLAVEAVFDLAEPNDSGRIYAISQLPKQFNAEPAEAYNALSGLTIYRGGSLGEEYHGNAFVGESLSNLVLRRVLEPRGPTFTARDVEQGKEFLASTDSWFHPVNFATGPDGALYVVDFYRQFVEHPDWVAPGLRDGAPWQEGRGHGRIWRIRKQEVSKTERGQALSLASVPVEALIAELGHKNGWRRDTAQRLLVERGAKQSAKAVSNVLHHDRAHVRAHAMWILEGLHALSNADLRPMLTAADEHVRSAAIQLAARRLAGAKELEPVLLSLQNDSSELVRFHLALALGESRSEHSRAALADLLANYPDDEYLSLAVLAGASEQPARFLTSLAGHKQAALWKAPRLHQFRTLRRLGHGAAGSAQSEEIRSWLAGLDRYEVGLGHLAIYCGLATGSDDQTKGSQPTVLHVLARQVAADQHTDPEMRASAIDVFVAGDAAPENGALLLDLLQADEPQSVQLSAARAIGQLDDPELSRRALQAWSSRLASVRRSLLSHLSQTANSAAVIVEGLESGQIAVVELDDGSRKALAGHVNSGLRERAQKILAASVPEDRRKVLADYQVALTMPGDRQRGGAVFSAECLSCHSMHGRGQRVGPDLTGAASRPKETLLVDLFDPSRQVSPDYLAYTALTTEGQVYAGLLVAENAGGVTLREAGGVEHTIAREKIEQLRPSGKSLMPDGMEQKLSQQATADLLEFLRRPDRDLLKAGL